MALKQVVQNYKSGELALLDVPEPAVKPGGVLVRTLYSLISTGTELMKVSEASKSLLGKAKARPDQVAKVMQSVATNGLAATYRKVTSKLDSYTPLGYSLCGVVTAVGSGIDDVAVGDLVACAGNEHALHAEINWVPRNLYAKVPSQLDPRHAAFGTVGSIAMQGVRQGSPALGDVALVIGLGLIGQLVVQLLVASGVKVIGVDPDPSRCALAESVGASFCAAPGSDVVDTAVAELTNGFGVDQVYLAAGGSTNQPVEMAAKLARDRGTVVDIGKCSLNLPWNAYYEKELTVRFSRSYGPGRYDPSYELEGRDYPIGYVRWTERRNLECFLDLAARDKINVEPLISHVADFGDAVSTYRSLNEGELKAVAVLFSYPEDDEPELSVPTGRIEIGGPPAAPMGLSFKPGVNGAAADGTKSPAGDGVRSEGTAADGTKTPADEAGADVRGEGAVTGGMKSPADAVAGARGEGTVAGGTKSLTDDAVAGLRGEDAMTGGMTSPADAVAGARGESTAADGTEPPADGAVAGLRGEDAGAGGMTSPADDAVAGARGEGTAADGMELAGEAGAGVRGEGTVADGLQDAEPAVSNGSGVRRAELSVPAGSVEIGGPPGAPMGLSFKPADTDSASAVADGAELSVTSDSVEIGGPPAASKGLSFTDKPVGRSLTRVRVGFIGAGNYASSMLLPHLVDNDVVDLRRVVTTSALSAANAQRKFGFADASTDLDALLDDDAIDAVFVVTRHSSHADLTVRALEAGKAVFVEKPLALSTEDVDRILTTVDKTGNDRLAVGFNRRFAPLLNEAKARFGRRIGPASVRYLVNAGRLAGNSWYTQDAEGTRFAGEGGHFIDTVSWLVGDDPTSVYAAATTGQKDLQVVLRYPDGSTATITYATNGSTQFQKETIDLTADGKVLRLDDFTRASVFGQKKWVSSRLPKARDKGQARELASFMKAVLHGGPMPVDLDSLVATTRATLAVEASLATGVPVRIEAEPAI